MDKYSILKAEKSDIDFIIQAILEIEKNGSGSNTFMNMWNANHDEVKNYLKAFFSDEQSQVTEFALDSYLVMRDEDDNTIACAALVKHNSNYFEEKQELFQIYLKSFHRKALLNNLSVLPKKSSEKMNKNFVEYIYTNKANRGKGIAEKLISENSKKSKDSSHIYINVLENNIYAKKYYEKLGFIVDEIIQIDFEPPKIYPASKKYVLKKINH